jgi:hypothetical protein
VKVRIHFPAIWPVYSNRANFTTKDAKDAKVFSASCIFAVIYLFRT